MSSTPSRQTTCPACGAVFSCGANAASGDAPCWCVALPPLAALRAGMDCLCPACLEAAVAAEATGAPRGV